MSKVFDSIDGLLGRLGDAEHDRVAKFEAQFEEMVRTVVDGLDVPDVDQIAQFLHDAGKSAEDFRAAVQLRRQRLKWKADLAEADAILFEAAKVHEDIRAENERFKALQKEHEDALAPLYGHLQRFAGKGADLRTEAERKLRETAPGRIRDRASKLGEEIRQINLERFQLRKEAETIRSSAEANRESRETSRRHPFGHPRQTPAETAAADAAEDAPALARAAAKETEAEKLTPRLRQIHVELSELMQAELEA
jgi:hypothetical protein